MRNIKMQTHNANAELMDIRYKQSKCTDADQFTNLEIMAQQHFVPKHIFKTFPRTIPTAILMSSHFIALRNLATHNVDSLTSCILPWSNSSLSLADPYLILPCLTSAMMVYTLMRGFDEGLQAIPADQQKLMKKILGLGYLIGFGFMSQMPSAVSFYFLINALFSFTQGSILKNESVQKKLGMYIDPVEQKIVNEFMQGEQKIRMQQMKELQEHLKEQKEKEKNK